MAKARRQFLEEEGCDTDPISGMANLFDTAMVFAVALMVAAFSSLQISDLLTQSEATIVKNPGRPDMEIIVKKDNVVSRYKGSEGTGDGKGRRVGTAYELASGEIIYVPEASDGQVAAPIATAPNAAPVRTEE